MPWTETATLILNQPMLSTFVNRLNIKTAYFHDDDLQVIPVIRQV